MTDLPDQLGLFPLPGALLLPRAQLPLHVFEPRYVALIDDALRAGHRMIGMIQPNGDRLHAIGCAGRITGFREVGEGARYLVSLTGVSRFRLGEELDAGRLFRSHVPRWEGFGRDRDRTPETDPGLDRARLIALTRRLFSARGGETDWDAINDATDELLINALSMISPLEPEDKQALLEAPTVATRRETLEALIAFALAAGDDDRRPQ